MRLIRLAATSILVPLVLVAALAGCGGSAAERIVTVHHGAPTATLVAVDATKASPGDVRVFSVPLTDDGGAPMGNLRGTLTTTAIDTPAAGDEIRMTDLVFSFSKAQDQIVLGGESAYPKDQATIAAGTSIIRPVVGGSGAYNGARGYAETIHAADGSWKHIFHLLP
ncbi:MAG: hypothetical protein WCK58_15670 [Chloroflexota bacterium]